MNTIKGFISLPALADNLPGQIALFGELSTYSETFSRYKTNYADPGNYPGVELIGFTTKNDVGSQITLNGTVSNHILQVANWIKGQFDVAAIPSNAAKASFITSLTTMFPTMSTVSINEILAANVTQRMPDYVQWTFNDGSTDSLIKIWFADSRFKTQYDDYEIFVIPPVNVVDQLNNNTATVGSLINAVTPAVLMNKVDVIENGVPSTKRVTLTIQWNDPNLPGSNRNTDWYAVIYGAAGNDNDKIKAAIRTYISNNSLLTTWPIIYPALYAENEYSIIPLWVDIASPETGLDVALFRTMNSVGTLISRATARIPSSYANSVTISTYLNANLTISSAFWRSISFLAIGNPNNVGSNFSLRARYPDYMNIVTTSPDWGRMSLVTRDFIVALNAALEVALTMTDVSPVPVGYSRVVHNSRIYTSFNYDGFNYIVLTKFSYA